MKIVGFYEFCSLPAGTVFSYYEPCVITGLYRKGDTIAHDADGPSDFWESSIQAECINGDHPTVDDIESRWALYDRDAEFAVYEPEDIAKMKEMLG